jgi:hypothetical protein
MIGLRLASTALTIALLMLAVSTSTAVAAEFVSENSTESFTVKGIEGNEQQSFSFSNGDSVTCSKVKSESGSGTFPAKSFKGTLAYEGCVAKIESKETAVTASCEPTTFEVGAEEATEGEVSGSVTFGACTFTSSRCPLMKECTIKMLSQKYSGVTYVDEDEELYVKFALKEGEYESSCPSTTKTKGASYTGTVGILGTDLLEVLGAHGFFLRSGAYPVTEKSAQTEHIFTFKNEAGVKQEEVKCPETTYTSFLVGPGVLLRVLPAFEGTKMCTNEKGQGVEVGAQNCALYFGPLGKPTTEKFPAFFGIGRELNNGPACKFTLKNKTTACERKIPSPQPRLKIASANNLNGGMILSIELVSTVTGITDTTSAGCPEKAGQSKMNEDTGTSILKRIVAM